MPKSGLLGLTLSFWWIKPTVGSRIEAAVEEFIEAVKKPVQDEDAAKATSHIHETA